MGRIGRQNQQENGFIYRLAKKAVGLLMAVILFANMGVIPALARPDWPGDAGVMAEAGILMDLDSGTVMYGQNIHVPYPPASITKLLTALVVAENGSMGDEVVFSHDAVYNVEPGSGNKLNLEEGDKLSVEDCLYVMLLQSSNQAANALAEYVAGSREAFVRMMNDKIGELGCEESSFANPSGLNDENQYVSAYDMARIAQAAFANPDVLKISSSGSHSIPATINNPEGASFRMEHRLLITNDPASMYYCEGALAGKTGYTSLAGNTLVTCARRDGKTLVSVILKGKQPQYYVDAKTLLDFGFASFQNLNVSENERLLKDQEEVEIDGVSYFASELSLDSDSVITLPATADFSNADRSIVTVLPSGYPGHAVAMLQYTYNDRKVGGAYLYAENPRNTPSTEPGFRNAGEESEAQSGGGDGSAASASGQSEMSELDIRTPTLDENAEAKNSASPSGYRGNMKYAVAVAVLMAAAAAALLLLREKKREREEAERRRERRRQRILESGCSEEEFETLLQERYRARDEKYNKKGGK